MNEKTTDETEATLQKMLPRKKKVLFVITKSNFGGAQRYVYELATSLKKSPSGQSIENDTGRQHDTFETAVALGGSGILKTKLEAAGITVFPISNAERDINLIKEVKVLWRLFKIMREFKPDIVHLNSPKIGGLGAVAARKASVFNHFFGKKENRKAISKIIYTNHGWPFKEPRPEWQLVLIRIFSWLTVFLGGTTIVLSQTEKDDVRNWPLINKKLVVIANGLKPFNLIPKNEALKKLVGETRANNWQQNNWTIIGTISELHKNKGLPYAIEGIEMYMKHDAGLQESASVIEKRKKTAYMIVGEGEERNNIEALIKEKKLENNVILVGSVDEARECLQAFDIFLMSSVKEGLPFAILEAGFAEVPVISTSVGAIPEVIQNLETGMLIHPARPQQINNALIYLEEHPEIKKQMSEALKKKIEQNFNFEKTLEKVRKLYTA